MMRVTLERLETSDAGTFGRLILPNTTLFTGELPWRNNQPSISCIPKGLYSVYWSLSPRFGRKMLIVTPVTNRTGIRIHSANFMGDATKGYRSQLNGCIALGERLGKLDGQKALLVSSPAVRKFETFVNGRTFQLEIK